MLLYEDLKYIVLALGQKYDFSYISEQENKIIHPIETIEAIKNYISQFMTEISLAKEES